MPGLRSTSIENSGFCLSPKSKINFAWRAVFDSGESDSKAYSLIKLKGISSLFFIFQWWNFSETECGRNINFKYWRNISLNTNFIYLCYSGINILACHIRIPGSSTHFFWKVVQCKNHCMFPSILEKLNIYHKSQLPLEIRTLASQIIQTTARAFGWA